MREFWILILLFFAIINLYIGFANTLDISNAIVGVLDLVVAIWVIINGGK